MIAVKIIGLDLSGSEGRPSGLAILEGKKFFTCEIRSDAELLGACGRPGVALVAIDAPLNFPSGGGLRPCDRMMISRGLRVFPPTFGGMRKLTERGVRISSRLRELGLDVIEVHPRSSGVLIFGNPDRSVWVRGLRRAGFSLSPRSEHEVDAVVSALTGLLHLRGLTEVVGDGKTGEIVIPARGVSPRTLLRMRCCSGKPR